jgi:hypothetical protein
MNAAETQDLIDDAYKSGKIEGTIRGAAAGITATLLTLLWIWWMKSGGAA